jgi:hypothetical protein
LTGPKYEVKGAQEEEEILKKQTSMKENFDDPIELSLMKRLQAGSYSEVPEKSENDVASNKLKLKGAAY